MFPAGYSPGDENPQVADGPMNQVDDHLVSPTDFINAAPHGRNPVEGLLGRGDVVALGSEYHDGTVDGF